jgi:hypothetical protein
MKLLPRIALIAAAAACPAGAAFAQAPSSSFEVRTRVAAYCEINASPVLTAEGDGLVTGSVFESCNTQEGFQVVASHRPLAHNEWVAFEYAGQVHYLDASGWSEVANRAGAQHGARPISVRYTSLTTPLAINLTVTMF